MGRPRRALSPTVRQLLDEAFEAHLAAEEQLRRRDQLALAAATEGASWREVGAAVAMSPQAAHQRYRHQLGRVPRADPGVGE
jgi:hypothetical protein